VSNALNKIDKPAVKALKRLDRKLQQRLCHTHLQSLEDSAQITDEGTRGDGTAPDWPEERLREAVDGRMTEKTAPFYKKAKMRVYEAVQRIEAARQGGDKYSLGVVLVLQVTPRECKVIDVETGNK
jgi:hypothetical protein